MKFSWFLFAEECEEKFMALININVGIYPKVSFVFAESLNTPVFKRSMQLNVLN